MRLILFSCLLFVVFVVGCRTVNKSVDYYNACKADDACYAQMLRAANMTDTAVYTATKQLPINEVVCQFVAMLASNIVAFVVGVKRGKVVVQNNGGS